MNTSERDERGGRNIDHDTCAVCGDSIEAGEWHPFDVDVGDDGETRVYVFCSRACRAAWERE